MSPERINMIVGIIIDAVDVGVFTVKTKKKKIVLGITILVSVVLIFFWDVIVPSDDVESAPILVDKQIDSNNPIQNYVPSVRVYMKDTLIDRENEFVKLANSDLITILANCDNDLCLYYAEDKEFMDKKGFTANNSGMALLGYCVVPVDALKRIRNDFEENLTIVDSYDPTSLEIALDKLKPGFYQLRVQAVGAVDGLIYNGKEYYSTTGWIYYYFQII